MTSAGDVAGQVPLAARIVTGDAHRRRDQHADPLELLARDDKWFLGAGDGIVFAPPFPQWLDEPAFWDEATVHQHAFAPLYTVAVLDGDGRQIPLRAVTRRWSPAELTVEYRLANGITATEVRTVQPDGIFASEWQFRAMRHARVHLVAWTAQDAASLDADSPRWTGGIAFARTLRDEADRPLVVAAELACVGGATSWAAYLRACDANHPRWSLTPFVERWTGDGLDCELSTRAPRSRASGTLLYAAVHRAVDLDAESGTATFAMRLRLAEPALRPRRRPSGRPSGGVAALGTTATLGGASRRRWQEAFAEAPSFRCSDPYLEGYYWYRWYTVQLNAVTGGAAGFEHPALCEGIGSLHAPSARAVEAHAREVRWLGDPARARGVLRTLVGHQRPDGSFPERVRAGVVTAGVPGGDGTAHDACWGEALLAIDEAMPDDAFVEEMYHPLSRYADWLGRTRDRAESGLLDAVADAAVKSVVATVHAYTLHRCLERLAPRAEQSDDAWRWRRLADRTERAVRERMWRPERGMFSDIHASTGSPTGGACATAFYPYRTDIATAEHVAGLEANLLAPSRFWTPYPIPLTPLDDEAFDQFGEAGARPGDESGNGRSWPSADSHLVEALARAAEHLEPRLREPTARLLRRFVRMMFHDGDLRRANCFEHYNPVSGRASMYRGLDDHLGAWVNDLVLRWVAGIRPHDRGIVVDPFPFGLDSVEVAGVRLRGREMGVRIDGDRVTAIVDGRAREGRLGTPIEIPD